jgi:general stress protein YciG
MKSRSPSSQPQPAGYVHGEPGHDACEELRRGRPGFAVMAKARLHEVSASGGRAAHRAGKAHRFTREEARIAGRKGGKAVRARSSKNASSVGPTRSRGTERNGPADWSGASQPAPPASPADAPSSARSGVDARSVHEVAPADGRAEAGSEGVLHALEFKRRDR